MASETVENGTNKPKAKCYKLDQLFLRRLRRCIGILFPSCFHNSSLCFCILLGCSLAQQLIIYNVGLIPSQFYQVLGERDFDGFKPIVLQAVILIIAISVANASVKYLSGVLYVSWRGLLCRHIHSNYFNNLTFYRINVLKELPLDNADQRIAQDVGKLCKQLSDIITKLIISPLTITYYSYQCFENAGYIGPVSIYAYFIIGTIVNRIVMSPIVGLIVKQEKFEGDFRYNHSEIRTNAESVAFYNSEVTERRKSSKLLQRLLNTQQSIVNYNFFLDVSIGLFDYLGSVLSYVVISVPIFAGTYNNLSAVSLGSLISQNTFVSMYLMNCFTTLMDLANKVADLAGYVHRVGEMLSALDVSNETTVSEIDPSDSKEKKNEQGKSIAFDVYNLTYSAPSSEHQLLKDLTISFHEGQNVLVIGSAGCGKTSFFRILADLWKTSTGVLRRHLAISPSEIMFLPQKAFLTTGSLAEQVLYPLDLESDFHGGKDDRLTQSLYEAGLGSLIERCGGLHANVDWNWYHILSPGESQRLSFARLFYHRPQFAFLDEPTSALGIKEEENFFTCCKQIGITYATIAHRDSLKKFHNVCLQILPNGGWTLDNI